MKFVLCQKLREFQRFFDVNPVVADSSASLKPNSVFFRTKKTLYLNSLLAQHEVQQDIGVVSQRPPPLRQRDADSGNSTGKRDRPCVLRGSTDVCCYQAWPSQDGCLSYQIPA
jgi:hypothetical protein